jgi:hypothetical protein
LTIVEERTAITGGVDTHSEVHVAAALDPVGGLLGVAQFPASAAGCASLLGWLGSSGMSPWWAWRALAAVLGRPIAGVTGSSYEEAAESLVLRPPGLAGSSFPARRPEQDVVTGYRLDDVGRFRPTPAQACVIPAAGGLRTTAAGLARFGATRTSLLPAGLAGLISGGVPGTVASLLIVPGAGRAAVTMMSRLIPATAEEINSRLPRLASEG